VAQGKRKLSEIVNAAGLAQPAANKYLGVLSDLKIVEREVSVTEEKPLKSKKGLYRITDEFFQFWFKFIFPNRARLEMGEVQLVWSSISRELPQHLGSVYEQIAREVLMRNSQLFFLSRQSAGGGTVTRRSMQSPWETIRFFSPK
jgi:AAA+ ATPase superfamily predicted ATPase